MPIVISLCTFCVCILLGILIANSLNPYNLNWTLIKQKSASHYFITWRPSMP